MFSFQGAEDKALSPSLRARGCAKSWGEHSCGQSREGLHHLGALRLVAERDIYQTILKQMENFNIDEGSEGDRDGVQRAQNGLTWSGTSGKGPWGRDA